MFWSLSIERMKNKQKQKQIKHKLKFAHFSPTSSKSRIIFSKAITNTNILTFIL